MSGLAYRQNYNLGVFLQRTNQDYRKTDTLPLKDSIFNEINKDGCDRF